MECGLQCLRGQMSRDRGSVRWASAAGGQMRVSVRSMTMSAERTTHRERQTRVDRLPAARPRWSPERRRVLYASVSTSAVAAAAEAEVSDAVPLIIRSASAAAAPASRRRHAGLHRSSKHQPSRSAADQVSAPEFYDIIWVMRLHASRGQLLSFIVSI